MPTTQTEGQRRTTRITETENGYLCHRSHLQLQQPQPHPQTQPQNNSAISADTRTNTPAQSPSWAGSKRSRMLVSPPLMPQTNTMMHPVEEINQISRKIVCGDFDGAIVSLTELLKNIKLVLSGDAKITMPPKKKEHQHANNESSTSSTYNEDQTMSDYNDPNNNSWMGDDRNKENEKGLFPSTTSGAFEYDFFYPSNHNYSPFLQTSVAFQEPRHERHHQQYQTQRMQVQERSVSIFQNPLIVKGDCFEVPLDSHLCEEISCVAIYNLALSHQLKAISLSQQQPSKSSITSQQQQHTQAYLYKALSLYEYSHQISMKQAIPVRVPALHCMALVSNLGQIHHLLGKSSKAQQCNEYVLSVLMYTIDGRKETNNINTFLQTTTTPPPQRQRDDLLLDGFLAIVQHLSGGCTAAAA